MRSDENDPPREMSREIHGRATDSRTRLKVQAGPPAPKTVSNFCPMGKESSDPKTDPECEPLDQNQPAGSAGFFAGNCKFITRKLWGFYNQGGAFMHHGKFTTAKEAVEAHDGEARSQRIAFDHLSQKRQNALIEFLKSLQVLPPGSKSLVVDERGNPKRWPPSEDSSADER